MAVKLDLQGIFSLVVPIKLLFCFWKLALHGKSINQAKTRQRSSNACCLLVCICYLQSQYTLLKTHLQASARYPLEHHYPNGLYHLQVDLQLEDCVHLMKGFQVLLHAAVPLPATALLCSFAQAAMHLEPESLFYLSLPLQALHSWL
jgi:hypothetical protein